MYAKKLLTIFLAAMMMATPFAHAAEQGQQHTCFGLMVYDQAQRENHVVTIRDTEGNRDCTLPDKLYQGAVKVCQAGDICRIIAKVRPGSHGIPVIIKVISAKKESAVAEWRGAIDPNDPNGILLDPENGGALKKGQVECYGQVSTASLWLDSTIGDCTFVTHSKVGDKILKTCSLWGKQDPPPIGSSRWETAKMPTCVVIAKMRGTVETGFIEKVYDVYVVKGAE